jgi:hypothetical protein
LSPKLKIGELAVLFRITVEARSARVMGVLVPILPRRSSPRS